MVTAFVPCPFEIPASGYLSTKARTIHNRRHSRDDSCEAGRFVIATEEWLPTLQPEHRVLDVGCGDAELTAALAQQVPNGYILGVDRVRSLIDSATRRYPPDLHSNLRFRQSLATELSLQPEPQFDRVVSRACLHYLPHPGDAFAAIAANLKVGAEMHLLFLGAGSVGQVLETLQLMSSEGRWQPYRRRLRYGWNLVSTGACADPLGRSGFALLHERVIPETLRFDTRPAFVKWFVEKWKGTLLRLPLDCLPAFLEDFSARYPRTDGAYCVERRWVCLSARKIS